MAFLWKAIGFSGSIPGFPYTPLSGAPSTTAVSPTITWTVRPGTGDEDGRSVTIFSISLSQADNGVKELAQNAMKRSKSLLLPGILRCYGAVEHHDTIYIATEPCEPLANVVQSRSDMKKGTYNDRGTDNDDDDDDAFHESVALGLKSVGTALISLHRNKILHGNVGYDAVYVLPGGEWRLFGLELASAYNEPHSIYYRYASLLAEYRRPPESFQASCETGPHVSNIDSWGMACLIYETLGAPTGQPLNQLASRCKGNDIRGCRTLPRTLQSGFMGLCAVNPKMRHDIERFLQNTEFIVGSEFVQCIQSLEELSMKDPVERESFFEHLTTVIDSFPLRACKHIALQKLRASFKFGVSPAVVDPVLKIAARVSVPEEYANYVAPVLVELFAASDKMVRYRLLQRAPDYAPSLPAVVVNEQIWPHFVSGFSSTTPSIREFTVRALVSFAKTLNERTMTMDVPKYISQLQQDPEGAIRTNATIGLCLMAEFIPAVQRSKVLVHGFGRMLKDPFAPSRLGALRSFQTTLKYLTPQHTAEMMLPAVAPLTLDAMGEVRQLALALLHQGTKRMAEYDAEESRKPLPTTEGPPSDSSKNTDAVSTSSALSGWGWKWGSAAASPATTSTPSPTSLPITQTQPVHKENTSPAYVGNVGHALGGNNGDHPTTSPPPPPKLDTFDEGDPWGTDVEVNEVRPKTIGLRKKSDDAKIPRIASTTSAENASGAGPMKLRKKGGLGAARLS